ncbi:unnamed protein product [Urochloa decumbens]|uniref:Fe2OG dioxygenase domain-containing protein n=2 Tax=Urochloa decumbens TaxID=240449 RepID=A0ABC9D201_9POAL
MASSDALPVVDLAPFLTGDEGGIARATEAVREACRTHGFFRAVNHGVPAELLVRALELSAAFFTLPDEEKVNVRPAAGYNTPLPAGYGQQPAHSTDKNEYLVAFDPKLGFNVCTRLSLLDSETVEECWGKLTEQGWLIQEILNECMGLPPGFLRDYNDDRAFDLMIARRYFLGPEGEEENNGFGAHEDAGCVTFILQDSVGGLEVLKDGHWVPAEPIDGSIVVNIGDFIQVLSNGKSKSATHRVVRKPAHRHSFAFFFNIHGDRWVEPLPEFTAKIGEAPRYRRFLYKEYQQLRVRNKSHPPARPEDVFRITHYAI